MAIPDIIRSVVAIAEGIARPMMPTVMHRMTLGQDMEGPIIQTPAEAVARQGIVEDIAEEVRGEDNTEQLATSKITFLVAVPVQLTDVFIMPDGTQGGVVRRAGMLDENGQPYYREVFIGRRG